LSCYRGPGRISLSWILRAALICFLYLNLLLLGCLRAAAPFGCGWIQSKQDGTAGSRQPAALSLISWVNYALPPHWAACFNRVIYAPTSCQLDQACGGNHVLHALECVGIPAISLHWSSPNTCTHARDHLDTEELRDKDVLVLQNWQRFSP
jgi:hypothetical protein